jgi:hypothetical protein
MMSAKSPIVPFLLPAKRRRRVAVSTAETTSARADFGDPESQRALDAAARAVARNLGRQAAREYFAELLGTPKV